MTIAVMQMCRNFINYYKSTVFLCHKRSGRSPPAAGNERLASLRELFAINSNHIIFLRLLGIRDFSRSSSNVFFH